MTAESSTLRGSFSVWSSSDSESAAGESDGWEMMLGLGLVSNMLWLSECAGGGV